MEDPLLAPLQAKLFDPSSVFSQAAKDPSSGRAVLLCMRAEVEEYSQHSDAEILLEALRQCENQPAPVQGEHSLLREERGIGSSFSDEGQSFVSRSVSSLDFSEIADETRSSELQDSGPPSENGEGSEVFFLVFKNVLKLQYFQAVGTAVSRLVDTLSIPKKSLEEDSASIDDLCRRYSFPEDVLFELRDLHEGFRLGLSGRGEEAFITAEEVSAGLAQVEALKLSDEPLDRGEGLEGMLSKKELLRVVHLDRRFDKNLVGNARRWRLLIVFVLTAQGFLPALLPPERVVLYSEMVRTAPQSRSMALVERTLKMWTEMKDKAEQIGFSEWGEEGWEGDGMSFLRGLEKEIPTFRYFNGFLKLLGFADRHFPESEEITFCSGLFFFGNVSAEDLHDTTSWRMFFEVYASIFDMLSSRLGFLNDIEEVEPSELQPSDLEVKNGLLEALESKSSSLRRVWARIPHFGKLEDTEELSGIVAEAYAQVEEGLRQDGFQLRDIDDYGVRFMFELMREGELKTAEWAPFFSSVGRLFDIPEELDLCFRVLFAVLRLGGTKHIRDLTRFLFTQTDPRRLPERAFELEGFFSSSRKFVGILSGAASLHNSYGRLEGAPDSCVFNPRGGSFFSYSDLEEAISKQLEESNESVRRRNYGYVDYGEGVERDPLFLSDVLLLVMAPVLAPTVSPEGLSGVVPSEFNSDLFVRVFLEIGRMEAIMGKLSLVSRGVGLADYLHLNERFKNLYFDFYELRKTISPPSLPSSDAHQISERLFAKLHWIGEFCAFLQEGEEDQRCDGFTSEESLELVRQMRRIIAFPSGLSGEWVRKSEHFEDLTLRGERVESAEEALEKVRRLSVRFGLLSEEVQHLSLMEHPLLDRLALSFPPVSEEDSDVEERGEEEQETWGVLTL